MKSIEQQTAYRELYSRTPQLEPITLTLLADERNGRWYGEVWRDDAVPVLMECCDAIDSRSAINAAINSAAEILKAFLRSAGETLDGISTPDGAQYWKSATGLTVEIRCGGYGVTTSYRAAINLLQSLWGKQ